MFWLSDINLITVLIVTVIGMVLGMLWYSPMVFGKLWMKLSGINERKMKEMKKKGMTTSYVAMFLGAFVMNYVLAYLVVLTGATDLATGAITGVWVAIGFVATVMLGSVLWEGKPLELYLINVTHYIVALAVAGAILATW